MRKTKQDYLDWILQIYRPEIQRDCQLSSDTEKSPTFCRNITIQLTEDCNCACTYCYQGNKTKKRMSKEVGSQIVDWIFKQWDENESEGFINRKETKAIILDFIGGEPLLNIDVADTICSKFWTEALKRKCILATNWKASFSSNGALYFSNKFQAFLKKYATHVSLGITVDGPKELHDSCRIYKDGSGGNFDDAYKALMDYKNRFDRDPGTKVTISPDNLTFLPEIIEFFKENGVFLINANPINEHVWTIDEARTYYRILKQLADSILQYVNTENETSCNLFESHFFAPLSKHGEDNRNWCGGTGGMLAFDPDGVAYPCLRYMATSLGDSVPPLIIGDCKQGIYHTTEQKQLLQLLDSITRCSQSTEECIECPIAKGCAWCSAWNYQENGTPNKRSTNICNMHKARSLANAYFWNKYYLQENLGQYFHKYLPDEEALKFIDKDELELINNLETLAKEKSICIDAINSPIKPDINNM